MCTSWSTLVSKDCVHQARSLSRSKTCVVLQLRSEEDLDPNGPCQQYTDAPQVLRDLQANLQADKTLLMQVLASIWRKVKPLPSPPPRPPTSLDCHPFAACKKFSGAVHCLQLQGVVCCLPTLFFLAQFAACGADNA